MLDLCSWTFNNVLVISCLLCDLFFYSCCYLVMFVCLWLLLCCYVHFLLVTFVSVLLSYSILSFVCVCVFIIFFEKQC